MGENPTLKDKVTLYCNFCGKSQNEVKKLIAGPTVFICNECVDLCQDILRDENHGPDEEQRLAAAVKEGLFSPLIRPMLVRLEKQMVETSEHAVKFQKLLDDEQTRLAELEALHNAVSVFLSPPLPEEAAKVAPLFAKPPPES